MIGFLGYDPRPAGMSLGERLRLTREARGLSIEELAGNWSVDPTTIWKWEQHGRSTPWPQYIPWTAQLTGVNEAGVGATPGERIRACRRLRGMTQRQFGALFGVEQTTVSDWELGRSTPDSRRPDLQTLLKRLFRESVIRAQGDNGSIASS